MAKFFLVKIGENTFEQTNTYVKPQKSAQEMALVPKINLIWSWPKLES